MDELKLELYRSNGGDIMLCIDEDGYDRSVIYKLSPDGVTKSVYGEGAREFEKDVPVNLPAELLAAFERFQKRRK